MKIQDLIEASKKKPEKSWVIKADDWVRGSWLQQQVDIAQKQTGNKGPASTAEPVGDNKDDDKKSKTKKVQKNNFRNTRINQDKMPKSAQYKDKNGIVWAWEPARDAWLPSNNNQIPLSARDGARGYNAAKPTDRGFYESKTNTGQLLKEGGNIFKDENKQPVTQRINQADVDPTLAWLEKITGLPHKDFKLGSTGIRSTSGDMDISVNQNDVDKQDLFNKLKLWAEKNHPEDEVRQWVAKSGVSVHFKTPILGDPENGFVQTDLMFGDPEWQKFSLKGSGDDTPYKGMHRHLLMASVAKAQGMKWSFQNGLTNRESGELIAKDPQGVADNLLGKGAKIADLDSVESIVKFIKGRPDYEELVADAKEGFARDNLELPESYNEIADLAQRIR